MKGLNRAFIYGVLERPGFHCGVVNCCVDAAETPHGVGSAIRCYILRRDNLEVRLYVCLEQYPESATSSVATAGEPWGMDIQYLQYGSEEEEATLLTSDTLSAATTWKDHHATEDDLWAALRACHTGAKAALDMAAASS